MLLVRVAVNAGALVRSRHSTWNSSEVAPSVIGIFLITPLLDAVVFDLIELAGVEVQPVGCSVVSELFAINQAACVTAMKLTISFVFVLNLTAQFVQRWNQFARRVKLLFEMTPVKINVSFAV